MNNNLESKIVKFDSGKFRDQIDKIINLNLDIYNKILYTNNYEKYYNIIKDILFDNLFLIISLELLIIPYLFRKEGANKKFNYLMILAVIGLLIFNYLFKIIFRNFKIGKILRTNECLNNSNHIIFNKTIKPIETFKQYLDKPFHEFYINTSHNSYIPCNQNGDIASSEAIKRTLGMGARVIELDCFAKKKYW